MPTREELKEQRKAEAEKHLGLVKGVFEADTQAAIESAVLYEEGAGRDLPVPEARFEHTSVGVERCDTPAAVLRANGKACAVDAASYRYPGGNYENGGWGPEEALCAESNLQVVLAGLREVFYTPNRQAMRNGLCSDRAIYLSDIVFTTDGQSRKRDIIVCAPPNRRQAIDAKRSERECDNELDRRVRTVLHIAAANQIDVLVLPAFGCGWLGNDDAQVAGLFKSWIDEHDGVFESVVFAIPGGPALDVFRSTFGVPDPAAQRAAAAQQPEDDQDQQSEEDAWLEETASSDGKWVFD